jgi:DNA-binding transcriptional MerR regulator
MAPAQSGSGLYTVRTGRPSSLRVGHPGGISGSPQGQGRVEVMTDTSFAVADLQSRWYTLNDLDRAQAVKSIHQSGVSLRKLASFLNCSPSLLAHLLQAGQAPLEDRVLARRGELSTRALVRRAKATGTHRTALHREAIAFENEQTAIQDGRSILNWLAEHGVADADREQIIKRARLYLSLVEGTEPFSPAAMSACKLADKTVHMRRTAQSDRAEIGVFAGFARQLAQWALAGISDLQVRQRAFELAHYELTDCLVPAA